MFQLVKSDELIVGEKYYIKRKGNFKNSIGIFRKYGDYDWYDEYDEYGLAIFNILDDGNDHILDVGYDIESNLNEFYKIITPKEYYAKVKEKYDAKVLNIVLKRLVNEQFEW